MHNVTYSLLKTALVRYTLPCACLIFLSPKVQITVVALMLSTLAVQLGSMYNLSPSISGARFFGFLLNVTLYRSACFRRWMVHYGYGVLLPSATSSTCHSSASEDTSPDANSSGRHPVPAYSSSPSSGCSSRTLLLGTSANYTTFWSTCHVLLWATSVV